MRPLVFNACLLAGWALVSVGAGLWSIPAGLVTAGALLIAPAAFTHTHRGNRPVGGDKYIATSWVLFQPAERLFGGA